MTRHRHKAYRCTPFWKAGLQVIFSTLLSWLCVALGTWTADPFKWSSELQGISFFLAIMYTAILWKTNVREEFNDD